MIDSIRSSADAAPTGGEQFDLIVVGAGLAGCCAALSAAQAGGRVMLLEKLADAGGSSRISGGGFAFAGIPPQAAAGISDGPELLRSDLVRLGEGYADPDLVDAYVSNQAETYEWLLEQGVRFTSIQTGSGNSVPRVLRADTLQLFEAMLDRIDDFPSISRRHGVRAERLVLSDQGVKGLHVISGTDTERSSATVEASAVILTTGGFSRDASLVRTFSPTSVGATPVGGDGSTGDGLRMACAVGAGLRDMGFVKPTFGSHPEAAGASNRMMHPIYKGAVIIDSEGRRFVDESRPYKELGQLLLERPGRIGYQVFDATVMAKSDPLAVTYDFKGALEKGLVLRADSLEELARLIGVDSDSLRESVATYNEAIRNGHPDPFGRAGLPGGLERTAIETAPFFAYPSTSVLLATYCGLATNRRAQVLDVFGDAVPGLYAAGEISGGLHGAGYLSGTSLGKAAIFGRIAGQNAVLDRCQ